jgi:hypothetical protein
MGSHLLAEVDPAAALWQIEQELVEDVVRFGTNIQAA